MTKVLLVDDEMPIRRALTLNLTNRGHEVVSVATGEAAIEAVADDRPDIVLLDLGLPGLDGIDVIHAVRGWSRVPIVVLTVRDDEASKIHALDAGADDYVTKPFAMGELLARIRAALRRSVESEPPPRSIVTDAFRLDLGARRAYRLDGDETHEVRLTPTEWSIATHLARHPGRLVTQRQLVEAVWGLHYEPDPALIRVHMAHVRRKLERLPSRPQHFLTDAGIGYRFEP